MGATHRFHPRRWYAESEVTHTQHHHLRDGGGQGHHQLKAGAAALGREVGDMPAQTENIVAYHVQTNAASSQFGHFCSGAHAGRKHTACGIGFGERRIGRQQPLGLCAVAQAGHVQPGTVVGQGE